MPARDECQPQVIHALQKVGWHVLKEHFGIRYSDDYSQVYADLLLHHVSEDKQQSMIVIEVKCFAENFLDELYRAIGQYLFYQEAMRLENLDYPLYLTVPLRIHQSVFQEHVIQAVLQLIQAKILVIDLEQEEIIQWIN